MQPIDILREDFSQTLGFIDKCDNHIFQIKNWAVVTSSSIAAFSISQGHAVIVLANLPVFLAFLYLELVYKSFQDSAIDHTNDISRRIDEFLNDPKDGNLLTNYEHSFGRRLRYPSIARVFGIFKARNRGHIRNFYLFLTLISTGIFLLTEFIF